MAADGKKAASILRNWGPLAHHGACLHYVWQAFAQAGAAGLANGNYGTATAGWYGSPGKHPGDRNPPAGVPVWWGPKPGSDAGDVVISLGGGRVVATDYPYYGVVGVCTLAERERQIGRPYLGWTETMLGAPINYKTASAAGESEEDDMTPEQAKKLNQIHDRLFNDLTGERIAGAVWSQNGIGAKINRMADRVLAVYESVRYGKKGVRTTGRGIASIEQRTGRIELQQEALLAAVKTLADERGIDGEKLVQASREVGR
jgi:hypothetical protein